MAANQNKEDWHDPKDYQFIQEKVVPSRKKKWKKMLSMAVTVIVLGILLGASASLAFCVSKPWWEEKFSQPHKDVQNGYTQGSGLQLQEIQENEQNQQASGPGKEEDTKEDSQTTDGEKTDDIKEQNQEPDEDKPEKEEHSGNESKGENQTEPVIIEQRIEADLSDFKNMYQEISNLAAEVNRSIVRVSSVTSGIDWFQNPYETEDETSGFILAVDENLIYILVNYEHIDQVNEIRVTFPQGMSADASFRDADTDIGLAVITVKKSELPEQLAQTIEAVSLGESYSMEVGEPVLALGSPTGYFYSMLIGMVTSKESYAYVTDNKLELFYTDMQLSNSGEGIIVNLDGKIIGILTRNLGENSEFCTALSISRVKPLLEMLLNRKPRTYLGIIGMDLTDSLAGRLDVVGGVYVTDVEKGSPAAQAGIRSGDVILKVDESNVFTITALSSYIQEQEPGTETKLTVCRMIREDAVTEEYTVTLGQKD